MDISKRDAKVCIRVPGKRRGQFTSTVTTWGSTTNQILELRRFLEEQNVTVVVMEATSDYWKPFYYLLEESLPVMLVNARHARNLPGRKTDVSDAAWLAQLGGHGLLRASFVPPAPVRELREFPPGHPNFGVMVGTIVTVFVLIEVARNLWIHRKAPK
jgi:transposase